MAWLKSGACAAFVLGAALLCRSVEGAKPVVTGCTDGCLLPTNLARTARMNQRVGVLAKDAALEAEVVSAIDTNSLGGADTSSCEVGADVKPVNPNVQGFTGRIPHGTAFSCGAVVQGLLRAGLLAVGEYAGQAWDNGVAPPWNVEAAQSLAYMMYPEATALGCGVTSGCTAGNQLLVCRLKPSLSAGYNKAPFTTGFFNALKERDARGVDITKLQASDVNTDPDGKPAGDGAAALAAIPGAIPAAALTFTTLLGFASVN